MKRFICFAGILCAMTAAFSGCSKDGFNYGEIKVSPDAIIGTYRAFYNTYVHTDASGNVIDEGHYDNNPGWPGSYEVFYDFTVDGKIVGYTRYNLTKESEEYFWYLRQSDEQISKNVLNVNVEERMVETNLWRSEMLRMIIYSSDENEVQLWLWRENRDHSDGRYDVYKLIKVTDAGTIASLKKNPMEDTEENRDAVHSEIFKLLWPWRD